MGRSARKVAREALLSMKELTPVAHGFVQTISSGGTSSAFGR